MDNQKNIVAVDIDSTLHEYMHTVALVALNEFGIRIEGTIDDWESVFPPDFDSSRHFDVYNMCHEREYIFLTKPYPGSVSALNEIANLGYEVMYVSDRKKESFEDTIEWLQMYGFPNSSNLICCKDKRTFLADNSDKLATIIDDRPRTLVMVRYELGIPHVFSIKHDYNKNLIDIPGIHLYNTWPELLCGFKRHIKRRPRWRRLLPLF